MVWLPSSPRNLTLPIALDALRNYSSRSRLSGIPAGDGLFFFSAPELALTEVEGCRHSEESRVPAITFPTSGLAYNASMIAKDLLEILVCPACKQPLEYRESPESLKCKQCRRVYAVRDDIPIMLIDEATIEAS
jgi:uncharacterized protein